MVVRIKWQLKIRVTTVRLAKTRSPISVGLKLHRSKAALRQLIQPFRECRRFDGNRHTRFGGPITLFYSRPIRQRKGNVRRRRVC